MTIAGTQYDRLDAFPEGWRPKQGDKLVGQVIALDERESEYRDDQGRAKAYPIVTVLTNDAQEFAFHAYHDVARNELAKLEPKVGERIGIAYHGRKGGDGYYQYRIIMLDRETGQTRTPDWKRMRAEVDTTTSEPELPPDPPTDASDDIPF